MPRTAPEALERLRAGNRRFVDHVISLEALLSHARRAEEHLSHDDAMLVDELGQGVALLMWHQANVGQRGELACVLATTHRSDGDIGTLCRELLARFEDLQGALHIIQCAGDVHAFAFGRP